MYINKNGVIYDKYPKYFCEKPEKVDHTSPTTSFPLSKVENWK